MKKYDIILFDLDGTISNSKEGITRCAAYALSKFGINIDDLDKLTHFIGPPLKEQFMKCYGLSDEEATDAVAFFRERYVPTGIYETSIYPDMDILLKALKESGKTVALATSKPQEMAEEVLRYLNVFELFDYVMGAEKVGPRQSKTDVLKALFDQMNITGTSNIVLVGDTIYDVIGATDVGIDSIGVSYGFGDSEEMLKKGASYIASDVDELKQLLL